MKELECHSIFVIGMVRAVPNKTRRGISETEPRFISFLVLRCFQLGEFFLRAIHIVLSCDSQFKKLLLTP